MSVNPQQYKQSQYKVGQKDEQSPSVEQSDYIQIIDHNQVLEYFNSIKVASISQTKSDFYAYERFINVTQDIYNGDIQLNEVSFNINQFLVKQRISGEERKTYQLKVKKELILNQLALLDQQVSKSKRLKGYSMVREDVKSLSIEASPLNSVYKEEQSSQNYRKIGNLILSQEEHKQLILKLNQQRLERQRKRTILKQKQEQKLRRIQYQQKQMQLKRIQQEKRKKAQQIQEKLRKKRQMHQKLAQIQKQSDKKVKQLKNKKSLHEQIVQRFQMKVRMPLLEQQKKTLRERRQFAKAYSIEQIKSHQRSYLQFRQNSMKKSQAQQASKSSYTKPAVRSSKLQRILQEQKAQQRKRLIQKKMAIEQKLHRQQNYVQYLKQKFSQIKIDKAKEEQIKSRVEKLTVRRQAVDSRAIGINYLDQAKKRRRRITRPTVQMGKLPTALQEGTHLTALSQSLIAQKALRQSLIAQKALRQSLIAQKALRQSRVSDQARKNLLLRKRQTKIQTLIDDSTTNQTERIRKLKIQTQKINQAFKMKEQILKYGYSQKVQDQAVQLLLASIQAKMGIIDMVK